MNIFEDCGSMQCASLWYKVGNKILLFPTLYSIIPGAKAFAPGIIKVRVAVHACYAVYAGSGEILLFVDKAGSL